MPMLLLNRLLFVAEILIAEFMIGYRLKKKKYFALWFTLGAGLGTGTAFALPLLYNAVYTSFTFLILFAVTVPMLILCLDECRKNVVFCAVAAYTVQHFGYGITNLFMTFINGDMSVILGMYADAVVEVSGITLFSALKALIYVFSYFCAYSFCYIVFVRKIKRGGDFTIRSTAVMLICATGLFVDIVINVVFIYYANESRALVLVINAIYESLCSVFLLYIQFGIIGKSNLENELSLTEELLREKERQYTLSKDNIELINLKCHDLRHQIRMIGSDRDLPAETVDEIKNAISIYDAEVRTDNEALDIILTEKSLKCARAAIALTCVADGQSLAFMERADIYTLFGNALDNAIEAVEKLDKDARTVGVLVKSVGNMVSVNIYNPFTGDIKTDADGFPITNKADTAFHGIGIRSIRRIAEKYNGICTTKINNGTFALNVLLTNKPRIVP